MKDLSESLSNKQFFRKDFSGQDLSEQNLSHSTFTCCNFNKANLTKANCSYSDFTASTMIGTKCTYTDFSHTKLACVFRPMDAFGITWTMECRTFKGMTVNMLWWLCYIYFAIMMTPDKEKDGSDPRDKLITLMGKEKYLKLAAMFKAREI